MRIRKVSQSTPIKATVVNSASESTSETYSCDYINELNTYSTTEQRIGTWIDGKPVYRKVLNVTAPSSINTFSIVGTIGSFDTLVGIEGNIYLNERYGLIPIPQAFSNNIINLFIEAKASGNILVQIQNESYINKPLIIIVEYTKTTD